jgi:hypothetical protein
MAETKRCGNRWARLARNYRFAETLPKQEREAVKASLLVEHSALTFPFWSLLFFSVSYGLAGLMWSFVVHSNWLWSTLIGVAIGWLIAFTICLAPMTTIADDWQGIKDRQAFVFGWVNPGVGLAIIGAIVWGIRSIFGF